MAGWTNGKTTIIFWVDFYAGHQHNFQKLVYHYLYVYVTPPIFYLCYVYCLNLFGFRSIYIEHLPGFAYLCRMVLYDVQWVCLTKVGTTCPLYIIWTFGGVYIQICTNSMRRCPECIFESGHFKVNVIF